ncbi:MAG: competence/damage-inducible protein A [Actinomycetota bacterium]|nr:competence/damage-inducible protein A [Actinomycetota bacterium]
MRTCFLVAVGNELLDGRAKDTNSDFIADRLAALGIKVAMRLIVGDETQGLRETLNWAAKGSDLLIVTGGLGPTSDDITREAMAESLRLSLRRDPKIVRKLKSIFEKMGRDMPPSNLKQADIIEGASALQARLGTAPGQVIEHEGGLIILLPGVPREMRDMMDSDVIPMIRSRFKTKESFASVSFKIAGKPESEVGELVDDTLSGSDGVEVSYRAQPGLIEVRLEAWEGEKGRLRKAEERVREVLYPWLVAEGDESLEGNLGKELRRRGLTLAVAESCTGGMVGERITRVPGSSDYFLGGVISYSYSIKENLLGVDGLLLREKGAVCPEVAEAMARGVRSRLSSCLGISVIGVAGPGSGGERKPLGSVALGLSSREDTLSWKYRLPGDRDMVREVATSILLAITYFYIRGDGKVNIRE